MLTENKLDFSSLRGIVSLVLMRIRHEAIRDHTKVSLYLFRENKQ
jgi:hypothetical protein